MFLRFRNRALLAGLLVFWLCSTSCTVPGTLASATPGPTPVNTDTTVINSVSTAHFTLIGGQNASYTLRATTPDSELRHGHLEFTILLRTQQLSLFIVFYGYQGPGNYTLRDGLNGGDVHIGLQKDTISWDLLMQPTADCSLTVSSDTLQGNSGLNRMRGSFACPLLFSSSPSHPQKPVQVSNGTFDIAILVAS